MTTEDLCVCGPMTRADGFCECDAKPDLKPLTLDAIGDEEGKSELRYGGGECCGDPADCQEAIGRATLDRPYFDLDGNEGTLAEVYS